MEQNILIVGGGITGLSAAYLASKQGAKVTLLEGSNTFGGLLNTFDIAGTKLEFYYHHFFTHDAEIMWLIKELGLEDSLVFNESSMGVFKNGRIYPFNSPVDLLKFTPISFLDKIKFGLSSIYLGKIANWQSFEHITAKEWLEKWAGKTTTNSLWKPLLDIKFGPYAAKIPLAWMIGRMRQRLSSREKGNEKLGYLNGSLDVLLQKILQELKNLNVELKLNKKVKGLKIKEGNLAEIFTEDGESFIADKFLITTPTNISAKWFEKESPSLYHQLSQTKYFGAVCVILEMNKKLSDTYWLNVAEAGFPFGGIIEHTNLIPKEYYQGKHIAYLSRYFAIEEPIATMDNEAIKALMLPYLEKIYPTFELDQIENSYVFKTYNAATVCDLNFSDKVPACETEIKGLYIANMNHIYPDERSTNNAIRVAAEACKKMGFLNIEVPYNNSLSAQIGF